MLKIEIRGTRRLAKDLELFAKRAVPFAVRDALNGSAFEARRIWGDEIRRTLTTRNTFTAGRALQVDKAMGFNVRGMESKVGSVAEYMGRQERGGVVRGRAGRRGIPGPSAAGQAPGGKRTKPVRRPNRLSAIHAARGKGKTRQQRNAVALAIARRRAKKYALLERPRGGMGLFLVGGGKRKIKTRLLWDVSRRSARVAPHPTLGPALRRLESKLPAMHRDALLKQLQRHRVLGY